MECRVFHIPQSPDRASSILALIGFVGLCLLVGASGGAITAQNVHGWYATLHTPPGTPPDWLFAPVWTARYIMMGLAAWLVWRQPGHRRALRLWGWQLLANALWVPSFFGLHAPGLALVVILAMLALTGMTWHRFVALTPRAAWLMLPYAAWSLYATWLNVGFWWLNPSLPILRP